VPLLLQDKLLVPLPLQDKQLVPLPPPELLLLQDKQLVLLLQPVLLPLPDKLLLQLVLLPLPDKLQLVLLPLPDKPLLQPVPLPLPDKPLLQLVPLPLPDKPLLLPVPPPLLALTPLSSPPDPTKVLSQLLSLLPINHSLFVVMVKFPETNNAIPKLTPSAVAPIANGHSMLPVLNPSLFKQLVAHWSVLSASTQHSSNVPKFSILLPKQFLAYIMKMLNAPSEPKKAKPRKMAELADW
jgi:hypothetical protein